MPRRAASAEIPEPMEAQLVDDVPAGEGWQYEPKWDGFRCIARRSNKTITLQSKSAKPLNRYFPELVAALQNLPAVKFMIDGEIVVPVAGGLDFNQLLQRIHPAESRVRKLSAEHPAHFMVFDLLEDEKGESLVALPLRERRERLAEFAARFMEGNSLLHLSAATDQIEEARRWLASRGSLLDGIMAKRLDASYVAGKRSGMVKYKKIRTADCVVGGFRYLTNSKEVGSLLLGLYDQGVLHHVGFASGIKASERQALTRKLRPLVGPPGFTGRAPGGPSRWSTERSAAWEPLKPELVVEVSFDHVTAERFRHGTKILRWRPDKAPEQCTMDQITAPKSSEPVFDFHV
jgi:ATP-dependent DNA ligase